MLSSPVLADGAGTPDEAKAMALAGYEYVQEHGLDKGIEEFKNPNGQFIDRDLYIFVFNIETGVMEGHGVKQSLVGKDVMAMRDADGKFFFREMKEVIEASSNGEGWVEYKWPNPVTKKIEAKKTFLKRTVGNSVIGSGAYAQ